MRFVEQLPTELIASDDRRTLLRLKD